MSKIDTLNGYIEKCDQTLKSKDLKYAEQLQDEIVGVYSEEIKNITYQLDNYAPRLYVGGPRPKIDFLGDIEKLKAKLSNYRDNLELELSRATAKKAGPTFNISQNNSNSATSNSSISFEQTLKEINALDESVFSEDEKELLQGKLFSIENLKKEGADKNKLWDKAKNIIGWLLDKSVDVGIAALPYIIQTLK